MTLVAAPIPYIAPVLPGGPNVTPKRQSRVVFLDVVRGLAALAVLLQHTNEVIDRHYLFWSFRWVNAGRTGVAAFFLVSGFVIPYSLERVNSIKSFWVSRFFRLYPLYWASLLIVLALHFAGLFPFPDHWPKALLANISMFQEFVGQPHLIGLYWTLTLEMVFYISFSVLFALGINRKSLLWAWLGLGMMILMGLMDRNGIEHEMHHKLPVARFALLEFALIGTVIFRYHSGLVSGKQLAGLLVGAAIALALAMRLSFRGPEQVSRIDEEWSWLSMFLSYVAGGALFTGVYLFRARQFPFALRWLGTISYSVYLLHYPTWLMLYWIPHDRYPIGLVWIAAVIVGTVIVASATYLLVEKPAIEFGKRLLGKPRSQPIIASGSLPSPAPV
jgi:peptidoglycan/LPS O-acetylase OafA/YrhL